jgi:hypothetical protein
LLTSETDACCPSDAEDEGLAGMVAGTSCQPLDLG